MNDTTTATRAVTLSIDGHTCFATTAMSVAAALAVADQLRTRTSVGGAPRFAVCGMGVCQECRVTIDGQPQRLACQVRCREGMVIVTGEHA